MHHGSEYRDRSAGVVANRRKQHETFQAEEQP
jgi:hypothetical protein